jgi:hypothetical protein
MVAAGKTFTEKVTSTNEYKTRTLSVTVHVGDDMFTPLLYDEFKDTMATVKIVKIKDGIAYCEFSGKLYNNRTEKKHIDVKGCFKFIL